MKQSILLSISLFLIGTSAATAQQTKLKIDSIINRSNIIPLLSMNDSVEHIVIEEEPAFENYNAVFKQRLDSIQKAVPLEYNEFVQKYIDIYSKRKDMMGKMLGLSEYYFPIFEQALKSYDIPEELKYIPVIESAMNPLAVSRMGATGIWQFMFSTAKGYGLDINNFVDERKDPVQASIAAAAYFRDSYADLGDWLLSIAAYNCGRGNVNRAIAKAGSRDFWDIRPYLPMETRNYVPAFIAAVYVMNCAQAHQITHQQSALNNTSETIQITSFVSLPKLAEALNVDESELCNLNPGYKRKIVNGSIESPKIIIVPKTKFSDFDLVYSLLNNPSEERANVISAANDDVRVRRRKLVVRVKTKATSKTTPKKYLSYKSGASSSSNSGKM